MSVFIYSTLTCDNIIAIYADTRPEQHAIVKKKIIIKGGHGVANKALYTPQGVVTEVSDDDYELLQKDYHFNDHVKNGFLKVEKRRMETEKAINDMSPKDGSAPITPADYEKGDAGNHNFKPKITPQLPSEDEDAPKKKVKGR